MRSLPLLVLAFAAVGCTESTKVDNAAHTNVTGTWAVQWTGMTGQNTVKDTTIVGVDTTVTDSTVSDTCSGTATLKLQQASPVAYVTGTYVLIRICRSNASQRDSLADTFRDGRIGPPGLEPGFPDPKSGVLPLDEGPARRKLVGYVEENIRPVSTPGAQLDPGAIAPRLRGRSERELDDLREPLAHDETDV